MQFKAIVLSGVLGLVAAQSSDVASLVAELPSCSLTCLLAGASAADCESMDYSCQCNKQDVIVANATSCLTSSCNTNDIATTQTVSQQICEAVTGGNSTSSSSTGSNATTTGSSTSSSASASSTGAAGSSAGSRPELYGLGLAAIAGVAGLMMVM
ncbi:cfem domain-containing protein [Diaporthe amygdali]|uniref:cfem domain-containing protein n=1 Tax=Phomopsis amygdali TaxID=1214568 RepID=UPI0022FEDF8E|nr:cfem domain-containing protein [Diaporthe amygdali]KAJ0119191.1 cfem domain-containing protein [Diaporthe amygdali]